MITTAQSKPESRLFQGYWQDGSLDLAAGLALVTMGIFWLTGPTVAQPFAPLIAFVLYPTLRRFVTEPRLGHVRFNAQRRAKLRLGHWVMLALGVVALSLGIGLYFMRGGGLAESSLASTLVPGLPAALVGIMSIGGAIMLGLGRFLGYAAVLITAGAVVVVADAHPGWALLAGGVATTLWGVVLMFRFVREYPIAMKEME